VAAAAHRRTRTGVRLEAAVTERALGVPRITIVFDQAGRTAAAPAVRTATGHNISDNRLR